MNFKQLMLRDGAPAALFMTPAARARVWLGRPLTTIPLFQVAPKDESAETKAFRAQEEERRRLKSLASIGKMKTRMATKAIDFSKVRWDARRNKFVPLESAAVVSVQEPDMRISRPTKHANWDARAARDKRVDAKATASAEGWDRVNKDTAERLAKLNGVWDDKYAKLSGGLLVMTVTNRLKGLVKKGGEVKWQ